MQIHSNTFIVTGGVGGCGKAVAKAILEKGGYVVLFDIVKDEVALPLAQEISKDRALYIQTDITDEDSTKKAVKVASNAFEKKLAGAVHCAGIAVRQPWSPIVSDSIANFRNALNVNTLGTYILNAIVADAINERHEPLKYSMKEFFKTKEERGAIINFASVSGHDCYARNLGYGPTKSAVLGITRTMSDFLGESGIRVNSISPSIINSNITGPVFPYFLSELERSSSFPARAIEHDEIAGTVLFLIENGMMNGQDIRIDGGWRLVTDRHPDRPDYRTLAPGLE
ncbi:NAD(P)-binding protein [Wallemia mellicola]|nr:NAD(P)-binding protein [Wallemia mellicola]